MKKIRKYTADEVKELIERYEQGATLREIGETEDLTRERIRQIFQKAGYKPRRRTVSERVRESIANRSRNLPPDELERLYTGEQKTAAEIASIYNCSAETVLKYLARYNIPRRATACNLGKYGEIKYHELNRENILRWYLEEDKNTEQIAKIVGCAKVTVFKRLKALEIRKNKPYKPRKV